MPCNASSYLHHLVHIVKDEVNREVDQTVTLKNASILHYVKVHLMT